MWSKPLTVAAVLVLGIFGCDDPEVQDKVESIFLHGSVDAETTCVHITRLVCSNYYDFSLRAHLFIDGSSVVSVALGGNNAYTQFNSRDQGMRFNGSYGYPYEVTFDDGQAEINLTCSSLNDHDTASINLTMYCTGRNLSAFDTE